MTAPGKSRPHYCYESNPLKLPPRPIIEDFFTTNQLQFLSIEHSVRAINRIMAGEAALQASLEPIGALWPR